MSSRVEQFAQRFAFILGVVFLLIGIFTSTYDIGTGIFLAAVSWIAAWTITADRWNTENVNARAREYYYKRQIAHHENRPKSNYKRRRTPSKTQPSTMVCRGCGSTIDRGSIFCPLCGHQIE